jgi:hypothetical protein
MKTPRRIKFRQGLSSLYLPYYDDLCDILGPDFDVTGGIRTIDEQTALYERGRTKPGEIVTNARGGYSAHNYGCATDWAPMRDGQPYWPDWQTGAWKPYLDALEKVGLRSGSEWGDLPHNELRLNCAWAHIFLVYKQVGMTGAQQKIEVALVR